MLYNVNMGLFKDRLESDYQGVRIQVESEITHLLPPQVRTRLLVNGQAAAEVSFFQGQVWLPGTFFVGEQEHRVKLLIHHGLMGTDYRLEIDGQDHPLTRLQ